jgi:transposase
MLDASLISATELACLEAAGLGALGTRLMEQLDHARREIDWRDAKLQKLTFEMAQLKRVKFGRKSEQLDAEQRALFDEAIDADIAAVEARLKKLLDAKKPTEPKSEPPQARSAAAPPAPRRSASRARVHRLLVRLRPEAHRRGRE